MSFIEVIRLLWASMKMWMFDRKGGYPSLANKVLVQVSREKVSPVAGAAFLKQMIVHAPAENISSEEMADVLEVVALLEAMASTLIQYEAALQEFGEAVEDAIERTGEPRVGTRRAGTALEIIEGGQE